MCNMSATFGQVNGTIKRLFRSVLNGDNTMSENRFPYKVWPGLLALIVLIASGVGLKHISDGQHSSRTAQVPQQADGGTIDGWAKKIREMRSAS